MRLQQYLKEENVIQKALNVEEPEVGDDFDEGEIADMLELVNIAIGKQSEKVSKLRKSGSEDELKSARAILKDLEDKKDKLENWKKETKPSGPNPEPAMGGEEPPPDGEEPPPDGEEPPPDGEEPPPDEEEPPPDEEEKNGKNKKKK